MPQDRNDLSTPVILIDQDALEKNLRSMQDCCNAASTELWPHIKTHKLAPILRRQLELGAIGATCAKLGEAEAMLPSGVRRIFIAHSVIDFRKAARMRALQANLDELILAVTSELQFEALAKFLEIADIKVSVLLAINTGLSREGVRTIEQAKSVLEKIRNSPRMTIMGLYTHEGHAYGSTSPEEAAAAATQAHGVLVEFAEALGGDLPLWPGCSVTATFMAGKPGVKAVRPGSYVFSDLSLTESVKLYPFDEVALNILATVVDRPEPGLALIDAGSKVFSGDKSRDGIYGRCQDIPTITVTRVSEEHGFLSGEGVDNLEIGQRLRFQPAHVCPVLNLASRVYLTKDSKILDTWTVDGRGRSD